MKKIVLICGLIAGAIAGSWGLYSAAFCHEGEMFEYGMWFGYASQLLGFSLIFVGIKNYRDNHNASVITFGEAFKIGALIALIASTVYVVAWIIDYKVFIPDFTEKYTAHILTQMQKTGAKAAEIKAKADELAPFNRRYKDYILFTILITYAEILPAGIVVSLIAAVILKRKTPPADLALQA